MTNSPQTTNQNVVWVQALKKSGSFFVYAFLFDLFGIFVLLGMDWLVKIVAGIILSLVYLFVAYGSGLTAGKKEFKMLNVHRPDYVKIAIRGIIYTAPFFVLVLLFLLVGNVFDISPISAFGYFVILANVLIFEGAGVLTFGVNNPINVLLLLPFVIVFCVAFAAGYTIGHLLLQRQKNDISAELRAFSGKF